MSVTLNLENEQEIVDRIQAINKECRALTEEAEKSGTTKKRASDIEAKFNTLMEEHDMLSDRLSDIRRPRYPDVLGGSDEDGNSADILARGEAQPFGLAPQQRMLEWVAKRAPDPYRGLTPGAYLRAKSWNPSAASTRAIPESQT